VSPEECHEATHRLASGGVDRISRSHAGHGAGQRDGGLPRSRPRRDLDRLGQAPPWRWRRRRSDPASRDRAGRPALRAEKSWKLNAGGTPGSVGGKLVSEAVEPLIGVVDFDGRTIYLAEQGDVGTYTAHLTDPDTLQIVYVESGDAATIYRFIVKRAK
jgi:hypothetical protein